MDVTSGRSVWRLLLLIGAPLAFVVTGLLHLVPASEASVGNDFYHVIPHSSLWIGIHVIQLVIISFLAWGVAALTSGLGDIAATVSRAALVPFVAFYSAFDAIVGLAGGLLARYVSEHPPKSAEISQAADAITDPLSEPILIGVYVVGVLSWLVAVLGAVIALRRAGASLPGLVLLVAGATIFAVDHAAPFGPVGMGLFLIGAVMTDRARWQRSTANPAAERASRFGPAGSGG